MPNRFELAFQPVSSSGPSFESSLGSASVAYALESTALSRTWDGPGSRSVRLATIAADDYYVGFGSTLAAAASTDSMLMLGGTVELVTQIKPSFTHIAFFSSTDVTVNVTLGYGS